MEAKKLAFEDRAKFYADPAYENVPVQKLISDTYADQRRKLIDENSANTVEPGMSVLEDGDTINLESGFPYSTIRGLMKRGHEVEFSTGGYGGYQAIMFDTEQGVYYGASESRKDGHAAGY
ncbi:MAG: gamma-glutamyltransferase [Balneolaceae bacterium]|nr:gamma-glutamyltransferase [Balneolaceae bacterium]